MFISKLVIGFETHIDTTQINEKKKKNQTKQQLMNFNAKREQSAQSTDWVEHRW